MKDVIVDRALAAVRFIDTETRRPIQSPLVVEGANVRLARNASGLCVIQEVTGGTSNDAYFAATSTAFEGQPAWPGGETPKIELIVKDPGGRYLDRAFSVALPRQGDALFTPVDVVVYPSPTAASYCGSTVVRCSVYSMLDGKRVPIEGALLIVSVTDTSPLVLGRGVSDARGEALVFVPGIPLLRPNPTAEEDAPVFFDFFLADIWAFSKPASALIDPVEPVKPNLPGVTPIVKGEKVFPGRAHHFDVKLS